MISESFKKGDLVMVEGSLRNDSWEKDGVKHSSLKVRVNNFSKITRLSKNNKQETSEPVAF
jgi:single-stranded DNA-binding protein